MKAQLILFAAVFALAACGSSNTSTTTGAPGTTTSSATSGTSAAATSQGATSSGSSATTGAVSTSGFAATTSATATASTATTSAAASTTSAAATAVGSTTGEGTTTVGATTGGATTSGASTGGATTGSTTSGSVQGGPFQGSWDMDWSQLSLNQTGNSVTGFYVQWGYSLSDPANAGSISGTVSGNVLTGTLDDNENDGAVALSLTLDTNGYLHGTWNGSNPLCGVTTGNPLPAGCGWSDTFTGADADGPITLTQTGQEVVGGYAEGQLAGLVADFRLNGVSHSSNNITGHFSWAWTSFSETAFSGNSLTANGSTYEKWCGAKSGGTPPSACLGGGGLYDGTWLMNLGVLTVRQPLNLTANPVTATGNPTGVWFEYGASSAPEYTLTAPTISVSGLDWTDTSAGSGPGGGVNLLAGYDSAFQCFSMTGTGSDGSLFCGSVYCADANFLFSDFLGVLPSGCGMSNSYYLYRPSHANENPSPSAVVVTEKGPSLYASFEDSSLDIAYGQAEQNVTGTGAWIYFTGFVTDGGAAVNAVFDWYPSIDDTSFAGDQNNNQIAWCGNSSDSIPNPCDQ